MVLTKGNYAVILKLRICQRHIRFQKALGFRHGGLEVVPYARHLGLQIPLFLSGCNLVLAVKSQYKSYYFQECSYRPTTESATPMRRPSSSTALQCRSISRTYTTNLIRFAASFNVIESFWNGAVVFWTSSSSVLQSCNNEGTVAIDSPLSLLGREVL